MHPLAVDLLLAAVPFSVGLASTWRLVWPPWKLFGKAVAYFGGVALLSTWLGHWSLLLAYAHQALGLVVHIWFCRRHGFTWYAVEDPERYVALSKEMVGYVDPPDATARPRELDGVRLPDDMAMQCEGEREVIEWRVDDEDWAD